MMIKHFSMIFLLLVTTALFAQPRYNSSVFAPKEIRNGDAVQLVYDAKGTDLEFSDEIMAKIYSYEGFRWRSANQQLSKNAEGLWTGPVAISSSTAFVGVKFFQGDINNPDAVDNNADLGYGVKLLDANGNPVAGAYLAEAAFQQPIIAGGGLFDYYINEPQPLDAAYLRGLAEKEKALSGNDYLQYFDSYMKLQELALGLQFRDFANDLIRAELKSGANDEALRILYQYASFRLKDKELGQEVAQQAARTYPNGATARFIAYNNIKEAGLNTTELIASYEDFLQRFPISEWRKTPNNQGFIYYAVYRGIGTAYFENKQYDNFTALYDDLDFRTGNELMRWNIMRAYMFKTVGLDTLYQVSEAVLPKLISKKDDNSYMNDFQNKAFADSNMTVQLDDRLFTHISLLNDLKKYDEARKYFFELSDKGRYRNAELNAINMQVLETLGDGDQMLTLLEMSVRENAVTPRMFEKLKDIYLKQHDGKDEEYENYLMSLKSEDEQQRLRDYIQQHLVHKPMPDFSLEAAEGHRVSLADWKGKIVVVDFWATWCRPCIMAFPGMQLLVDKYEKDPLVEVYMLGTMMDGDFKEKSEGFIAREGYRFNQLLDNVDPKTGKQSLLFSQMIPSIFADASIPRKIVLKDGVVRYASGGYSGSPSKLVDELSFVIELLRNEK